MIILSVLFFITAILYSSVGFGGGSTYLALLLIWDIPYFIFPIIALLCNIIVVSGNSFNYIRAGNHNFKLLLPFLIGSVPFAFLGGTLKIEKDIFEILLFFVLSIAGFLLLINNKSYENNNLIVKKLNFLYFFINWLSVRINFWNCGNWRRNISKSNSFLNKSRKTKNNCYNGLFIYID